MEANHDHNRWWPPTITDPRMRMLAAGWSTRINYRMIDTYATVLAEANKLGFDALTDLDDDQARDLIAPLGLTEARLTYLYSLADTLARWDKDGIDPAAWDAATFITAFTRDVRGASYKVAQCAALYARGYHCGIIPVDSGMVTKLAPALGFTLPPDRPPTSTCACCSSTPSPATPTPCAHSPPARTSPSPPRRPRPGGPT
ncbi:hypothetical protein ACFQ3Z_00230 [Streptomyces nogalater]